MPEPPAELLIIGVVIATAVVYAVVVRDVWRRARNKLRRVAKSEARR